MLVVGSVKRQGESPRGNALLTDDVWRRANLGEVVRIAPQVFWGFYTPVVEPPCYPFKGNPRVGSVASPAMIEREHNVVDDDR